MSPPDVAHVTARAESHDGAIGVEHGMVTMYTTTWCGYCVRLKRSLDAEGIIYREVNIEVDDDAAFRVMQVNNGNQTVPTLEFADGSALTNPSISEVRQRLAALN